MEKTAHGDAVKMVKRIGKDYILTGSRDGNAKLWKAGSYEYRARFVGHTDQVVTADCHPKNPNIIVTGGWDQRICVQNIEVLPKIPEEFIPSK